MEKADSRIETIFSHAVALHQSGRMRNTIHVIGKEIYLLNTDRSLILRFSLPKSSYGFKNPISFKASDYDSNQFYEKEGNIVFKSQEGEYIKEKSCSTSGDPNKIKELFSKFTIPSENRIKIQLNRDLLRVIEDNLSHIEIMIENGEFKLIQRNIYDGTIIIIRKEKELGLGIASDDSFPYDFGPIGIRTTDFLALFSFNDTLSFFFSKDIQEFCKVFGRNYKMNAIMSYCLYDEMGNILTIKEKQNGRKVKKGRRRK